jgi:hypothetical protein
MPEKQYFEVAAEFGTNGTLIPKSFWWDDEKVMIDQVFNIMPMASTKGGGRCAMHTCIAHGKTFLLFLMVSAGTE